MVDFCLSKRTNKIIRAPACSSVLIARLPCLLFLVFTVFATALNAGQPYGLASRPAFTAFNGGALPTNSAAVSGSWFTEVAFPNLTFHNPVGIAPMPGTNNLVVWEREGRVYFFDKNPTTAAKALMVDLSAQTQGWDDSGLLGLAFHPNFTTNRYVFLYYTYVTPGTVQGSATQRPTTFIPVRDRLVRYSVRQDGTINLATETILIDQSSESVWHNGGGMFFHPDDGFLYLSNGDDEQSGRAGQIDNNLHSGVFRIDVDQRGGAISHPIPRPPAAPGSSTANYYIPNDNPFVGMPGILEEFFCVGLRSPHRMTIDHVTKRIFIGDVGSGSREEIDIIEPGESALNFQWSSIEGLGGALTPPFLGVDRPPVLDYGHDEGTAIIGGYVYRGSEFPELSGKYIFGDNGTGNIYYLDESTVPAAKVLLTTLPMGPGPNSGNNYVGLSGFGEDANHELYLCQLSSTAAKIYKLARDGPPVQQVPLLLSQTGVLTNLANMTPATGFVAYDVNTPLWSDGAQKQRWFAVPNGKTVGYAPTGEWTFPEGSVFVKNFELPIDDRNPLLKRRVETRVLVRDDLGYVYGATYKWRADLSDADLVVDNEREDITITNSDGSTRVQSWFYPGRQTCLQCHTPQSKGVLGLNTPQTHRTHAYPGASDNQLRTLNHVGYFSPTIDEASLASLQKMAAIEDTSASVEHRVRSYLDANCSHCHRPGGVAAFWDARVEVSLAESGIVDGPVLNDLGVDGARVVTPGDIARSILHLRDGTATESYKMPPIAKNVVDQAFMALLDQWIPTVTTPPAPPLPAPWLHGDIGSPAIAGSATPTSAGFIVNASGNDIWNNADAFHFVYRDLSGDGGLIARVATLTNTDQWAKAGVMIRESLAAGSKHASTLVTPANGINFQRRGGTNGDSSSNGTGGAAPAWVRIHRAGNVFISSTSPDGVVWTEVGRGTIPMSGTVKVGLCLTSHNDSTLGTAAFDNVTFIQGAPFAITEQPESVFAHTGEEVSFDVKTIGDPPSSIVWRRNTQAISGANGSTYTIPSVGVGHAGSYTVLLSGNVVSESASLAVVGEASYVESVAETATATIAIPFGGTGITFEWRKDGVGLESDSRIAGTTEHQLTIHNFSEDDVGNYTCVAKAFGLEQVLGPYHLALLESPDVDTMAPPAAIVGGAFTWQLEADEPSTFTVSVLPSGLIYDKVTQRVRGTPRVPGEYSVTVTANNAAGTSLPKTYTITVQEFPSGVVGSYIGLVERSPSLNDRLGGRLSVKVTATGMVTGSLVNGARATAYSLLGKIVIVPDADPVFTQSLPRKGEAPYALTLTFDRVAKTVSGTITLTPQSVAISGRKFATAAAAKPFAGTYNTVLRLPAPADAEGPLGTGWVRVSIDKAGLVKAAGKLPDGTAVSFGSRVRDDLSLRVFARLYASHGSILGEPTLQGAGATRELSGVLDGLKTGPASVADRSYADGYITTIEALGRPYRVPATGTRFLGLGDGANNAKIDFAEGGIEFAQQGAAASQPFTLSKAHLAVFAKGSANPCATSLLVDPLTGIFTGNFRLKDGSMLRTVKFTGLFVPGETSAFGVFRLPQMPNPLTAPIYAGQVEVHAP